jgi:membrane-bound lytic murein transglycosylase B
LKAFVLAAAAMILVGASARAQDCGRNAEGFNAWLASFKQVAVGNGVSPRAVDAALDGVAYDPASSGTTAASPCSGTISPVSPQAM